MKNFGNLISAAGIILFVYSIVGRFVGDYTIGLGVVKAAASSGMIAGIGVMLIGIIAQNWEK